MTETFWTRTKTYSSTAYTKALKPGFDKAYAVVDKLGPPVNKLSNRLGSEAFWPTTLDKESDKAARILRSFCKDGFYSKLDEDAAEKAAASGEMVEGPRGKQRVLKKIPEKVIREAKGLAIFTTMRTGLWVSGAGGSGILIAKNQETGVWSPPSGIMLHTAGVGFLVGVDIYDCVVVINTEQALEAFMKIRCTLGGEVSAVAGPVGIGGVYETELHKRQAPVWTYLKSRGFYAGVQVDGTIIIERTDENETFYGERIGVRDILAGKARHPPTEKYRMLIETIKMAQGEQMDESLLPEAGQAPSDFEIVSEGKISQLPALDQFDPYVVSMFGVPDESDPDPFGVKALEAEGLNIREAGTHQRPSADAFEFRPSPTSPIYTTFRGSVDGSLRSRKNGWRASTQSLASVDRATQTDSDEVKSPSVSPHRGEAVKRTSLPVKETEHVNQAEDDAYDSDRKDSFSDVESEPEIQTAVPVVARAVMVTVPKRIPPALPARNPGRVATAAEEQPPTDGFTAVSLEDTPASSIEVASGISERPSSTVSQHQSGATDHSIEDEFKSMPHTPEERARGVPGSFQ